MNTIIISDVHLGSKYFLCEEFRSFLDSVPAGSTLVLNGDTVDYWHRTLPDKHREMLDLLKKVSLKTSVIWVRGNHDECYVLDEPAGIEIRPCYNLGKRLFISHGYDFDNIMPKHRVFIVFFRFMHHLRIRLGAESVHVAFYAKKWRMLYNFLRKHVAMNAIEYARENGYEAVTCGHTHYVEDRVVDGIRYINTGSWTEKPNFYLSVNEKGMKLEKI